MCTHACSLHMPSYWLQRLLPSWWHALMLLFPLNSASTCVSTRLLQQMGFAGSASINKVFKKFTSSIWTKHMLSNKRSKGKGMFLYSAVSSPWDCSNRFTLHPLADLFIPIHFSGKHSAMLQLLREDYSFTDNHL